MRDIAEREAPEPLGLGAQAINRPLPTPGSQRDRELIRRQGGSEVMGQHNTSGRLKWQWETNLHQSYYLPVMLPRVEQQARSVNYNQGLSIPLENTVFFELPVYASRFAYFVEFQSFSNENVWKNRPVTKGKGGVCRKPIRNQNLEITELIMQMHPRGTYWHFWNSKETRYSLPRWFCIDAYKLLIATSGSIRLKAYKWLRRVLICNHS